MHRPAALARRRAPPCPSLCPPRSPSAAVAVLRRRMCPANASLASSPSPRAATTPPGPFRSGESGCSKLPVKVRGESPLADRRGVVGLPFPIPHAKALDARLTLYRHPVPAELLVRRRQRPPWEVARYPAELVAASKVNRRNARHALSLLPAIAPPFNYCVLVEYSSLGCGALWEPPLNGLGAVSTGRCAGTPAAVPPAAGPSRPRWYGADGP